MNTIVFKEYTKVKIFEKDITIMDFKSIIKYKYC